MTFFSKEDFLLQKKQEAEFKYSQMIEWASAEKIPKGRLNRIEEAIFNEAKEKINYPLENQKPKFYFPNLTVKPWHDTNNFSWITSIENNFDIILKEYFKAKNSSFKEHPEDSIYEGEWTRFCLYNMGVKFSYNCSLCPETIRILNVVPNLKPISWIYFSHLKSNTKISPHYGPHNGKLRCHLALSVPEGDCKLEVGREQRKWEIGKCLVFDDSFIHQVWNDTSEQRAVLLFDFWHPELTLEEINAISFLRIVF